MPFAEIYRGKRVLITGHTGFKGAWLAEWLLALGAEATGLALPPNTLPSIFDELGLEQRMHHHVGDIRDLAVVRQTVEAAQPDFVFHLAAQPLVRLSYEQPVETYAINVLGTVHLLEAVRLANHPCTVVVVTSDKCYENREWTYGYREEDSMGGYDPYSSSKGAAELAINAYRRSYFSAPDSPIRLASARAGNVIGGGDRAMDRMVPDCIRALQRGESIPVRNKAATRPWQHVLEPLSGYLQLAATIHSASLNSLSGAFNFGPALTSNRTVAELVHEVLKHWPGRWEDKGDPKAVHEAKLLNLATDKAFHFLNWRPVWTFEQTVEQTVFWYRQCTAQVTEVPALTSRQIADYTFAAKTQGIPWAQ